MAARKNQFFPEPENKEISLWRYMDFAKFVSLLSRSCLHFARADLLGDPFEGAMSKQSKFYLPGPNGPEYVGEIPSVTELRRQARLKTFVNCWHASHHESDAMWRLYGRDGKSVAIKTTYSRLDSQLPNHIWLHSVRYIDFEKDELTAAVLSLAPFFHKRHSFEHEKEVRAVIQDRFIEGASEGRIRKVFVDGESADNGRTVPVDLNTLVDEIVVSPLSEPWFFEVVAKTAEKFGAGEIRVSRSCLLDDPLF
jgi:hypothetical protein